MSLDLDIIIGPKAFDNTHFLACYPYKLILTILQLNLVYYNKILSFVQINIGKVWFCLPELCTKCPNKALCCEWIGSSIGSKAFGSTLFLASILYNLILTILQLNFANGLVLQCMKTSEMLFVPEDNGCE